MDTPDEDLLNFGKPLNTFHVKYIMIGGSN